MLRHMVAGIRRFGVYPMYIHQRDNWEFFAVLRGKCGALFSETGPATLQQRHLWIFPPETAHGWKGDGPNRCKIVVFHFGKVPALLEKVARERGFLDSTLSPAQVRRVAEIEMELRAPYGSVTEKSLLFFEKAVIELSLMALADVPFAADAGDVNHPLQQVQACLSWYSEHMIEQPKLEQTAQAVNTSVRHLRRLFWQARHESPQAAFTRVRLERAMGLLSLSNLKLEAIAEQCGFSSGSDFCRVFKMHHHVSPDAWRKRHLPPYQEPAATRK